MAQAIRRRPLTPFLCGPALLLCGWSVLPATDERPYSISFELLERVL